MKDCQGDHTIHTPPLCNKMILILTILLVFCNYSRGSLINCNDLEDGSKVQICTLVDLYDQGKPDWKVDQPMLLENSVTILSVADFNADAGTITLNLVVFVNWNDTRLTLKLNDNKTKWYALNDEDESKIYFPSMKVNELKNMKYFPKYGPLNADYFWFGMPHHIEYAQSFQVTIYCSFDFSQFPFDDHECDFQIGSASSFPEVLNILPSTIRYGKKVSNYGEKAIKIKQSRLPFDIEVKSLPSFHYFEVGYEYVFTGMKLRFRRNSLGIGRLLGSYFGPTAIFSSLSLISFSIKADVVPGRLGLLVTLDLIAYNVYNSMKAPQNRGFSFVEVWMLGTQIPILVAILEYAIVLALKKYWTPKSNIIKVGAGNTEEMFDPELFGKKLDKWTFMICSIFLILFFFTYTIVVSTL